MFGIMPGLGGLAEQLPLFRAPECPGLVPAIDPNWLHFNKDGKFQISIFEDLHFGCTFDWKERTAARDRKTVEIMNDILDLEPPDLVVLNGDLIHGDAAFKENATVYIDHFVAPMVDRGIPWGSVHGNHDHAYNLSGADMLARERRFQGSLTRDMVQDPGAGVTNYFLPVYGADCTSKCPTTSCTPELLLWFFDSRGGFLYQEEQDGRHVGHENWVHPTAVEWFRTQNSALTDRYGKTIPSLAFTHIPVEAARILQAELGGRKMDPHRTPGINFEVPVEQQAFGWCRDGRDGLGDPDCKYGGQDEPFMRALADTPGLIALFFGHDHGNTWCGKWDRQLPGMSFPGRGIQLCYGQRSGYGGYGEWIRGARQVLVTREMLERREVDTWIRLEDGKVVGSVSLNGTYGQDEYPETPNDISPHE